MYHLDFESYSTSDLRSVGAYRYAADLSTEILLCAISYGDNLPVVWDAQFPDSDESRAALRLIQEASASSEMVYAHNAPFEIAVSTYQWEHTFGCNPPGIERWRCTAAMCRRAAIPWSLAGAADFLGLDIKKDKAGARLIQLFSVPQKGAMTWEDRVTVDGKTMTRAEAWVMFREYCRRDVEVEREIHGRLKAFELKGTVLESFLFDLKMNHLGVPVDLSALRQARKVVDEYNEKLAARFTHITGLAPSQTMAFLGWMREHGYGADDLRADTMEAWMNRGEVSGVAREALGIRAALSFAAVKKIDSMIECACPDNRIRGSFMWYGAVRTGRWSGRLVQFQNVKRPAITALDTCYDLIAEGAGLEAMETLWDKPLEAVASVVRNFVRHETYDFIDTDLANIEGRVAGWLAGDEPLLSDFRAGVDVYKIMAGSIYGVGHEEVTKSQRMTGKIAVLSCGYGTGWRRFQEMASAQGHPLDDEMSQLTVFKYRKARQPIVATWRQFGEAAIRAIRNPGEEYKAGEHVVFRYGRTGGFAALTMRLPSGRRLVYPHARVLTKEVTSDVLVENEDGSITTESKTFTAESVSFYGPKQATAQWGEVETHGSKLFENACQAVAGDFLVHGLLLAQEAGYEIPMVIHDQALAYHRPETGHTLERFLDLLTTVPSWAPGFPLKAEASVARCYSK